MKKTFALAALALIASGTAAFAAEPTAVLGMVQSCCDLILDCCKAGMDCCPK